MSAEPIPHEALLRHAGFLRHLARDLLGDHAAADDAVQEVWLRALEKPPRHDTNVRGWLRVVLTNLVRSKARGESRRELRERARAHHEADPPASASSSEDEALLRAVTESVLALEEPLRSTVLQHYFQGLTTAEIAQREHLPVSTVKSRLQRALEILRARMKREAGESWQAGLLALTRPDHTLPWAPHVAPAAKVGTGVLLMTLKTKVALGSVAVLLAWLLLHEFTSTPARGPSESLANFNVVSSVGSEKITPPPAMPTLEADSNHIERRADGGLPGTIQATAHKNRPQGLFYGSLVDSDGNPLKGLWYAWVSITDSEGRRRNSDAKTEGSFAFSGIPLGKYWVSAGADGYRAKDDVIEITSEVPQVERDFSLDLVPMLRVRVVTHDGENLFDVLRRDSRYAGRREIVPVATKDPPGDWFTEVVGSLNNPFGVGHFWDYGPRVQALPSGYMGLLMLEQSPPLYVSLLNWHAVLQTKEVGASDSEVTFVLEPEDVLASVAAIRVQVVDTDGLTPLPGASVSLSNRNEERASTRTGAGGVGLMDQLVPCEGELVIGAKDHASRTLHVVAKPGTITDVGQVVLDAGITLSARVFGPSGEPVSTQVALEYFDSSTRTMRPSAKGSCESGPNGTLSITNLGRYAYVLRTANLDAINDQDPGAPKFVSGSVSVDLRSGIAPKGLEIHLAQAGRLALLVKGGAADGLRFRALDESGAELVAGRFWGNAPRPLSLPPGKYSVELLDRAGAPLSTRSVTLGADSVSLELSR